MSLTKVEQVQIKGALVMLKDAGHNPDTVTRMARTALRTGTPHKQAYQRAFAQFFSNAPDMRAPLMRMGQLVEASDIATLSLYNLALDNFIASGKPEHLDGIMPTIMQDAVEMAARTGDAGFVDGIVEVASPAAAQPSPGEASEPSAPPQRVGWGPEGFSPSGDNAHEAVQA